jgi:hypothetical protein
MDARSVKHIPTTNGQTTTVLFFVDQDDVTVRPWPLEYWHVIMPAARETIIASLTREGLRLNEEPEEP